MTREFRIFTTRSRAERFAKKHNGVIIVTYVWGTVHYEVWYDKEGESK